MRRSYEKLFTETDCVAIYAVVPKSNPSARVACVATGGVKEFSRPAIWPTKNGPVDAEWFVLRYGDWIKHSQDAIEAGESFAKMLDLEKDETHLRHIGAMLHMLEAGQIEKAMIFYNRFARISRRPLMEVVAIAPLVIKFNGAVLHFAEGLWKVLKWG